MAWEKPIESESQALLQPYPDHSSSRSCCNRKLVSTVSREEAGALRGRQSEVQKTNEKRQSVQKHWDWMPGQPQQRPHHLPGEVQEGPRRYSLWSGATHSQTEELPRAVGSLNGRESLFSRWGI